MRANRKVNILYRADTPLHAHVNTNLCLCTYRSICICMQWKLSTLYLVYIYIVAVFMKINTHLRPHRIAIMTVNQRAHRSTHTKLQSTAHFLTSPNIVLHGILIPSSVWTHSAFCLPCNARLRKVAIAACVRTPRPTFRTDLCWRQPTSVVESLVVVRP